MDGAASCVARIVSANDRGLSEGLGGSHALA
jgi:hypothetical protein